MLNFLFTWTEINHKFLQSLRQCIGDSYNKFVNVTLHIFEFYICLDYISCVLLVHEDILRIVKITYLDSLSIVPLIINHI